MNTDTQSLTSAFIEADAFMKAFGDRLAAVYIYNRFPDEKILLVPTADVDIHQLRIVFRENGGENIPIIVPQSGFVRHMRLFPLLAQSLQDGKCLRGTPIRLKRRVNGLSHWAQEAMEASAAVGNAQAMGRLQALAREILGRDVDAGETAVSLLAAIHRRLASLMDDGNVPTWNAAQPIAAPALPDPALQGLVARYRFFGAMVYVFDDSLPDLLAKMDGKALLAALEQPNEDVRLVTARQLRLALARESSAAFILQNYNRDWGADPLADFSPDRKYAFRDAARKTAVLRTNTFIHDYFLMPDDDEAMHTLIHDFQNKLLNVQLEHELLYRLLGFERFLPPALPDRSTPSCQRLDAIFGQLDWWSAQYAAKMNTA